MRAKHAAKEPDDFIVRMLTRGKAQKIELGAPEHDPVARAIQMVTDRILEHIGSRIQDKERALLLRPDRVLIRTIPPAGINALTMWIAPRHVVAVNQGLALFLYRLARAFSAHVIIRGPGDPPAPPESQAVGIIATLLDWMASPVRAPLVEDWLVGPREIRTADNFTTAAERFVMAHEIAHILHRHLIADSAKVEIGRVSPLDLDTRPVEQEITADVTGAMLAIESTQNDGIDPRAAVAGIQFFLQALALAEKVGAVHVGKTHPPAEERLAVCHDAINERYGPHASVLRRWGQRVDQLLGRLASAALKERNRRLKVVAARMDEVLRTRAWPTHGRDIVEDRALLTEVLSWISQSPSAVMDALDANLLDPRVYRQLMATLSEDAHDRLRRHQIAHFIARHSPVQVRQALGVEMPLISGG